MPAPKAPTGLTATPASTSIALRWKDASSNEEEFRIDRRTDLGPWTRVKTLGKGSTSWTDHSVQPGRVYTYRLRAWTSKGGNSDWSNQATAKAGGATPGELPQAVAKLLAIPYGQQAITLADGMTLTLDPAVATLIEVITNPLLVGSVVINIDGARRIENVSPYAVPLNAGAGLRKITATPYTLKDGKGTAGTPLSLTVNVAPPVPTPDDTEPEPDRPPATGYQPHRTTDPREEPRITRTVETDSIATARGELAKPGTKVILTTGAYETSLSLKFASDTALIGNGSKIRTPIGGAVLFQDSASARSYVENLTIESSVYTNVGFEVKGKHLGIRNVTFVDGGFKNMMLLRPSGRVVTIEDCDQPKSSHYWIYAEGQPGGTTGSTLTVKRCKVGYDGGPLGGHTVRGYWHDAVFEDTELWNVDGYTALTWKMGDHVSFVNGKLIGETGFGPLADGPTFRQTTAFMLGLWVLGNELTRNTSFDRGVKDVRWEGNYGHIRDVKLIRLDTRAGTEAPYLARGIPSGVVRDNHHTGSPAKIFSGDTQDSGELAVTNNTVNDKPV